MNLSITCLGCISCCPVINSEQNQVAVADGPTASLGFPSKDQAFVEKVEGQVNEAQKVEGQVGHEEKVEGQVSEELFNQGREMAGVSKFVNIVEFKPLETSIGERSYSPMIQGDDDRKNEEVAGRESPPPPPPPPPPPLLRIDPSILSPGFYGTAPCDPIYGDRLTSIEGQREPSPLPEINTEIRSAGFMNYVPENALNGVVIEYKTWKIVNKEPSRDIKILRNCESATVVGKNLWV
jgi:hypothetical protein